MKKIDLRIEGMSCSACSNGLEKYLNKQEEIISANVNLVLQQASIEYNDEIDMEILNKYVEEAGFKSLGVYEEFIKKENKHDKNKLIIFTILAIIVFVVSMLHMFIDIKYPIYYGIGLFILIIPFLIYGYDILKKGISSLIHKIPNMDTLVSLGVISSLIYSVYNLILIIINNKFINNLYFESVALVIYFVKLGRYIDTKNKDSASEAIKGLVTITPDSAIKLVDNKEIDVTIDEIKVGDILVCKPGMKFAVDGTIRNGNCHVDEAFITGESLPSKKNINDDIVAGSFNIDGYIEYEAKKIGKDSTISSIVKLVLDSVNTKTPITRLVDKISSYFVPSIMILSVLTLIISFLINKDASLSIISSINVLVVACPCALGLATPLALVVSIGLCSKNGILIKKGEVLEIAHKIDKVVFDKTGTLTKGKLSISKLYNYSKYNNDYLLDLVSSLESKSTHPLSQAFKDYSIKYEVSNFLVLEGLGIKGSINNKDILLGNSKLLDKYDIVNKYVKDEEELSNLGNSIIYIVENNIIIGLIGIKDIVKEDAIEVIDILKKDKEVIMLTGDNNISANIVGKSIGIDNVIANMLPKYKYIYINNLIDNSYKVMMIGDGINDASSLASSTIGISFNSSTDIAASSSDIIFMNDNLYNIINLINISKKTTKIIKQNLFWAFFYNIIMIPIAMGIFSIKLTPSLSGLCMMFSSLTVVLNSLRIKKIKLGSRN